MIVTEEIAQARLNSPNNLVNKMIKIDKLHGGDRGPRNIPPMVQTLAVAIAKIDSQESAAQLTGMTQENVSYLANKGKRVDQDLVKNTVATVHNQALDAMLDCIGLIKPKLGDVKKATELSKIAADMSKVVNNTTPKEAAQANVQVHVYAPRMRDEREYEELTVST